MKVVNGQVMELDKALNESQDLNNVLINFKQTKDAASSSSVVYEGEGTDGRIYYIEVNEPVMCKVSIINKKEEEEKITKYNNNK
jgi:hypothetical protein